MIMDRALLKRNAKFNFKKQWGDAIVITLIMYGVSFVASILMIPAQMASPTDTAIILSMASPLILLVFSILILPVFQVGTIRFFQKLRMNVPTGIAEIFGNFKDGNLTNIVLTKFNYGGG